MTPPSAHLPNANCFYSSLHGPIINCVNVYFIEGKQPKCPRYKYNFPLMNIYNRQPLNRRFQSPLIKRNRLIFILTCKTVPSVCERINPRQNGKWCLRQYLGNSSCEVMAPTLYAMRLRPPKHSLQVMSVIYLS